jgi:hypothetical protein
VRSSLHAGYYGGAVLLSQVACEPTNSSAAKNVVNERMTEKVAKICQAATSDNVRPQGFTSYVTYVIPHTFIRYGIV